MINASIRGALKRKVAEETAKDEIYQADLADANAQAHYIVEQNRQKKAAADEKQRLADMIQEHLHAQKTISGGWDQAFNEMMTNQTNWRDTFLNSLSIVTSSIASSFQEIGVSLEKGTNAWTALGKGAVHALGAIVDGIGGQLAAMSAAALVKALGALASIVGAGAAPGFFAESAIEGTGAIAAYASGAALKQFAGGTTFAPEGVALVGELGPELVNLPRGSSVAPSGQTSAMKNTNRNMGGGHTFVFNSPKAASPLDQARAMKQMAIEMRFKGILI